MTMNIEGIEYQSEEQQIEYAFQTHINSFVFDYQDQHGNIYMNLFDVYESEDYDVPYIVDSIMICGDGKVIHI
jgi:hypothetical protein